jgi:hypothetical protein
MGDGTFVLDREFYEKEEKGTLTREVFKAAHDFSWFMLWVYFIIPAILILLAITGYALHSACKGETWGILFILAFLAGGLREFFKKS